MRIATLLNVHGDSELVFDTLESIQAFMTKDVLVVTDGAAHWQSSKVVGGDAEVLRRVGDPYPGLQAHRVEGFYHGRDKSPYRNMTLGLKTLAENWDADWYCYIEYDCLVTSEDFKTDLEKARDRKVWALGNDHRCSNYRLPYVEAAIGEEIGETHMLLGCCNFFHKDFMKTLLWKNFFRRFLHVTNVFRDTLPGFDEQGAYDVGEVLYPTLAAHYGGRVGQLAVFYDGAGGWDGDADRYPMRFRPEITADFPDASIIHPLKSYDHPIRAYHRERRRRQEAVETKLRIATWGEPPKIVGVILDVGNYVNLFHVKKVLIDFLMTLEALTEDKFYLYRPEVIEINRWVSQGVADVANYQVPAKINPSVAIPHVVAVLNVFDPGHNDKHVFYVTDRVTPHTQIQVKQGMTLDVALDSGCHFHLLSVGRHSDSLKAAAETHPRASYAHENITVELFKELISRAVSDLKNPHARVKWEMTDETVLPPTYDPSGKPLTAQVDLIVPYHGQYDHVSNLIQSLWAGTRGICYNLCLVDDGSPNKDFLDRINKMKVPSVFCVRHEERRGFGAAINTGIKATKSPWVVILNSDVYFEDGMWLHNLGKTYHALSGQGVKMVSARYDNPPPGHPNVSSGPGTDVILEVAMKQILEEDAYLPFVCVLANRQLFSRVGLVKEYPLGWYEDLEFACRMNANGFKQAVSGASSVSHVGGATVDSVCKTPIGPYNPQGKNRKIFESNLERCCLDIKSLKK